MDPMKEPGISFRGVYLRKLVFSVAAEAPKEFRFGLSLDVTKTIEDMKDGGKRLLLAVRADPMSGIKDKPFDMQVEILGVFESEPGSNLPIEEFAEVQAPALLVPYLRELISNITSRSPMPTLVLPPINVHALMARKEVTSEGATPTPSKTQ